MRRPKRPGRRRHVAPQWWLAALALFVAGAGCSGDDDDAARSRPTQSTATTDPTGRGVGDRVVIRGNATLDGAPFDAEFLGAVVRRDGLVTPCQQTLPAVEDGRYEITVLADTEGLGCGTDGAEVLLWTFTRDTKLFSTTAAPWPTAGRSVNFDASFSSTTPNGDAPALTEFSGEVFDRDGRRLPPGTRVEAYIDTTRCGVASVRDAGEFSGFVIAVVGPDAIRGCTRDGTISFRAARQPANETAVNRLTAGASGSGGSFDLTLP
jgi:hypothetical protein